jgi:hypothetical protein
MYHPSVSSISETAGAVAPTRSACLVAGCPCKDARIVSHRRAAFFADVARRRGQTSDRVVALDPAWTWSVA